MTGSLRKLAVSLFTAALSLSALTSPALADDPAAPSAPAAPATSAAPAAPSAPAAPGSTESDNYASLAKAAEALEAGQYGAAIDLLESLDDKGFVHPSASYDRGLAYLTRIHASAERPGDLGRAAAAFEETLRLRPGDADAEKLLDQVRAEVTRRRSRKGGDTVDARPTLDRAIALGRRPARGASVCVVAACLLAIGILRRGLSPREARRRGKDPPRSPKRSAGGPAHPVHVTEQ
ncbi:MAG: hypothetical protein R3B70_35110 [Polyangiaceae bacterium]